MAGKRKENSDPTTADQPAEGQQTFDNSMTFPPIGEPEQEAEEPATGEEDRAKDIEARIRDELRTEFAEERRNWQQTVDRLLQGVPQQQKPQEETPQQPQVDFSNLPDPVEKPQEFQQELQRRMANTLQAQQQYVTKQFEQSQQQYQTQAQREKALDDLWNKFQSQYQDLAPKEALLRGAIQSESMVYRQRGLDPADGILQEPDQFMERVAARMRKELGVDDNTTPSPTPNRTGGLAGGTSYNGASNSGGKQPPGFLAQLKKAQADSGLI